MTSTCIQTPSSAFDSFFFCWAIACCFSLQAPVFTKSKKPCQQLNNVTIISSKETFSMDQIKYIKLESIGLPRSEKHKQH